jgi:hypothetical protein
MGEEGEQENVVQSSADDVPGEQSPGVSRDVLEPDRVFETLDHPRRRYVCSLLREDDEWSLSALARNVAALETDQPENEVSDAHRDRVHVSLYHSHVPKLADCGVVSFDADGKRLSAAEHADRALAVLEATRGTVTFEYGGREIVLRKDDPVRTSEDADERTGDADADEQADEERADEQADEERADEQADEERADER